MKDNKEDNFSRLLGSIGWKKEWATNRSEIISAGKLSKLTNGVVFGLEKRITKAPISQTKADLWDILKALAPPDCLSMQADIKKCYKKLQDNQNLNQKSIGKMHIDQLNNFRIIWLWKGTFTIFGNFLGKFLPYSLQLLVPWPPFCLKSWNPDMLSLGNTKISVSEDVLEESVISVLAISFGSCFSSKSRYRGLS